MKVTYERETDTLTIVFANRPIEESDEDKPGVILDYDAEGKLVAMELLDASQQVDAPGRIEYQATPLS